MKKILSLFACLALVFSLTVTPTFATEAIEVSTADQLKNAIEAGGTIVLGDDIELTESLNIENGKEVTLDLAGHTISQTKKCTASYQMINVKGSLTVTGNGKISFTDTSNGDPTFGWGSYTIRNEGTLVVENGTIEHLGQQNTETKVSHMICAIFQYSGSTTINGGTISTPTYRSARLWHGEMTINAGTLEGQLWVQTQTGSPATLTINGGTFGPRGADGSSVYITNDNNTVDLTITGGTFTTRIGSANSTLLAGSITGGTFASDPSYYVADGYVVRNIDNLYVVGCPHDVLDYNPGTPATCTEDGIKDVWKCSNCEEWFLDEDATVLVNAEDDLAISKLGHKTELTGKVNATCTTDGYTGDEICTRCEKVIIEGEVVKALGHTIKDGKCTECDYEVEVKTEITTELPEEVKEVTIVTEEETKEVINETKTEIIDAVAKGEEVTNISDEAATVIEEAIDNNQDIEISTEVVVSTVKEEEIDEEVIEAIENIADKGTVATYLDLSVLMTVSVSENDVPVKEVTTEITQLSKPVVFTIAIPEELKTVADGYTRTFFIVRVHDDITEILPLTVNDDETLSFSTDKFSTYALAYKDVENSGATTPEKDPTKTGDDANVALFAGLAVLAAGSMHVLRRKEEL